ncbi:hypothetical protein QQF64_000490 [Cirrhinus molitorella]|uniref:Ig-like domain-containing protein n=1 Tax=Cirrhinus molitorella TaxID=172907 RepID=A0ABR3NXC4_9TELE
MAASLIMSLPLIFMIMTAGVDGQQGWGVNYSPSYVCALKGSTVKMSCTLKYPHYYKVKTVFWTETGYSPELCLVTKNRGRVQCFHEYKDTYSITLMSVTEADKHMYYCRFTTNTESGKYTGVPGAQLDVTDLQVETQQSVKEGDSVTLTCKSSCSLPEQTTFIWYRNTQRLTDRTMNNLKLQSVSLNDSGNYECAVSGYQLYLKSPPVYLNVEYHPKSISVSISPSAEIVEGDSVTLICSSDSNPPAEISWYKGETLLKSGDPYSFTNIKSEDSGIYKCSASNKHGSQTSTAVTVNVRYPPKSISVSISPSGEIVEGDSVTLICSSDSNPSAEISWYKGETFLKSGDSYSFTYIKSEDSGIYKCSASNKHGSQASTAVTVNVRYPPKSISVFISPSGEIVEGDSVTLICSSDSNPPAEISWFKEGKSVESGQIYNISNISSDHSGEYKCKSTNKHGAKDSDFVTLNVMYKPRNVVINLNSSEIVEGDSVTLNCSSDSNPPALIFSWFKENQSSSVASGQSFSISSFNSSHSGRYYCEAQNKYGSERSASVSVTVKGVQKAALHTVTGIVVGCGGLIFILIIIIVFIKKKRRDGGAEVVRQNQQEDRVDRSAETALSNDDPVYSLVSDNQTDDLYANIKAKKPKRSGREQTEKDSGDAEDVQYVSVHHFKNKDMKKTEKTIELQHLSDPNRFEDVIYSSVK